MSARSSKPKDASVRVQDTTETGSGPFPLVGIGASAGGLEAFTQLLAHLPVDTGMVFLLVQHLDPRQESQLTHILAKITVMPVVEAAHRLSVKPNHVYVIPPNGTMTIDHGVLQITPRGDARGPHLPVDTLFRSMAEDVQQRAIGVVLSGTGSDGTIGLRDLKAAGGITFAQDEQSAKYPGMPRSAIDNACVDFVLTPEAIALRIAEIGARPYVGPELPVAHGEQVRTDENFRKILSVVRSVTGIDFTQYRDTTIRRRIMRRISLMGDPSLPEYVQRLQTDREEAEALYNDLLITVTSFFRDPGMFEILKDTVFPMLASSKSPTVSVRIWVPGCSTGQEPYSLAMALLEFYDDKPICPAIQIFATDISDQLTLEKARAGIYPESIETEVSPQRLRRFFKKEDHVYRINKSVRDLCVFARQNVTADPPFSRVDLISCRNLLIYLSTPLQKRVLSTFHFALNRPGFLALGSAEAVGDHTDLFDVVDRANKVYAKKATGPRRDLNFDPESYRVTNVGAALQSGAQRLSPSDFQREADRVLLGRYTPPGVLVNENLDVVQFRGRTSPYLESPPGEPTTRVLKLAREGLFLDLRNALAEAAKQSQPVRRKGVRLSGTDGTRTIDLEVIPIQPLGADGRCFLVLFQEADFAPGASRSKGEDEPSTPAADLDRELLHLRQELAATKEYLQSLIEQQDVANEELRAANEEILSSNEEMQSANEELETAKEEVQSANEELTTLNEQLKHRNLELTQVNNDLTNLLSSTAIPLIMSGGDLRIRRITAAARQAMNLTPTDVGRPIIDTQMTIPIPDLEAVIGKVVDQVQPMEREVRGRDGRWYTLRVHPYRTWDNRIDGVVVVLMDIDQLKRIEGELREAEERMRSIVDQVMDGVITMDEHGRIESFNPAAESLFGYAMSEIIGQNVNLLLSEPSHTERANSLHPDRPVSEESHSTNGREVVGRLKDGSTLPMRVVVSEFSLGPRRIVVWIVRDLTVVKHLELARRQRLDDLAETDRRKDGFLATLAHELRHPLAPILNAVEIMRRAGDDPKAMTRAQEVLWRQVRQLSRIIEDLVDVSRISEQKIQIRKETVTLATVVEAALEASHPVIEARGHRLTVLLPPDPLYLDADPIRLTQILINLLNNAANYTEDVGQISLSAERRMSDAGSGSEVMIRVCDTGIGIPADLLPHIFDMFRQGHRIHEMNSGGLGIGLTLVRSLVQMHGGRVEANSAGSGQGSEFVVYLPEIPPPKPDTQVPTNQSSPSGAQQPKRVLVVDDGQIHAETLGMLLEREGHEVRLAYDGPSALEVAADFVPDVVLLDIGLPGMNGYEVARRIRAKPQLRHALLVAQTGWGRAEDLQRSKEAGFDHHVVKPADIEALLTIIASPRS